VLGATLKVGGSGDDALDAERSGYLAPFQDTGVEVSANENSELALVNVG
jgi:hypothetical protein